MYLRALLPRHEFWKEKPTPVYKDKPECIEWENNVIGGRERHIDIRRPFAHEVIQKR